MKTWIASSSGWGNYSREEIIQPRILYEEIRYIRWQKWHFVNFFKFQFLQIAQLLALIIFGSVALMRENMRRLRENLKHKIRSIVAPVQAVRGNLPHQILAKNYRPETETMCVAQVSRNFARKIANCHDVLPVQQLQQQPQVEILCFFSSQSLRLWVRLI